MLIILIQSDLLKNAHPVLALRNIITWLIKFISCYPLLKFVFVFHFSIREDYYQEGNHVHPRLKVLEAFKRALTTWGRWIDNNVDKNRTLVFFRGYSYSHFRYANFLASNLNLRMFGENRLPRLNLVSFLEHGSVLSIP